MSLLIKNLSKSDWEELLMWARIGANNAMIGEFTEVEEVPPHGRLGDLDALYKKFSHLESEAMNALKTTTTGSANWFKWSAILTERTGYKHDIADASTIIEAEEGGSLPASAAGSSCF